MLDAPADEAFRAFLAEGRFMIQRSRSTGQAVFPPRMMLPGDGRRDLEWTEASGRGTIHSFTVVSQKPPRSDYNICLVDLAEGPRLLSRTVDIDAATLEIGMAVQAAIDTSGDAPLLVFRPARAE